VLIPQMIDFVEQLPVEWQPQWEVIQTTGRMQENIASTFALQSLAKLCSQSTYLILYI
jgi:hypothetical protein